MLCKCVMDATVVRVKLHFYKYNDELGDSKIVEFLG
jgi:hypothetical protein